MTETNENKINFSEIDFSAFQEKIAPISKENSSLLKLDEELRKFDISDLSETEISIIELFRKISSIMLTDDTNNPFAPRLQLAKGARTCMPEDITEAEMDFFISILASPYTPITIADIHTPIGFVIVIIDKKSPTVNSLKPLDFSTYRL